MKLKKLMCSFALIGSMVCVAPLQALAASSSEIQAQIEGYMADLEASEQKSAELEDEIASKQEEVASLYSEVATLNIEKSAYYDEMKTRIAYFYEEMQGNNILTVLLTSSNFAEFISRIQFQQSIYDYDAERLEEYQELVDDLESKQEKLDAEIEDLGDMVEEQVVLQATLDATISLKQEEYDEAVAEEAAAAAAAAAAKAAEEEAARRAEEDAVVYAMSSSSSSESSSSDESYSDESSSGSSSSGSSSSGSSSSGGSYDMPSGSGVLTWSGGINYFNGHMETWYSMREWTGNLGIPGMYIGSDGIVRDCDGYICVASDDLAKGTVVETSLGTGKVYDCGPGSGIIDIYTDWPLY